MGGIKCLVGDDVLASSEIVRAIAEIKSAAQKKSVLFGDAVRNLTDEEIATLQKHGNCAEDWSNVLVTDDFNADRVRQCVLIGKVILGRSSESFKKVGGFVSPMGLYSSVIIDSEIGNDVVIKDVKNLSNYIVKEGALIANVGQLCCDGESTFGNGREIAIAIETGGREVFSFADITIPIAEKIATSRDNKELLDQYGDFVERFCDAVRSDKGIVEGDAVVMNTPKILNTYIGCSAVISGATLVDNVTILSNADEKTEVLNGAFVKNSILQWGCEVESMGIVDSSVLTEHSHVERHGKVTESIVGPNTGIAEGEVTASLVGPFVGFHHQALLIAALWPEGKGNVGYGANVGSNHTGKAPDQEILPGEGMFFGLSVNIKFPSDFSKSPYSVIATGVSALPQRIEFPFSLLNVPAKLYDGISPAYNEIFPGWVLLNNVFAVKRNEGKYRKRDKSRRSKFVYDAFRPDIMALMKTARERLQNIPGRKDVYTAKDVDGLGKNYMTERGRLDGVKAYDWFLQYYGLRGLKKRIAQLVEQGKQDEVANVLTAKSDDCLWEDERVVLLEECPDIDVKSGLVKFVEYSELLAKSVESSKAKDDKRGVRVIDDYAAAHSPASEDGFVKEVWKEASQTKTDVEQLIQTLGL